MDTRSDEYRRAIRAITEVQDTVSDAHGCPYCQERREDWLVWCDDGETIECATCGAVYTLDWEMREETTMDAVDRYQAMVRKIDETPELEPYRDLILYDWQEEQEHYNWIMIAPVAEIIEWAESIRCDEALAKMESEIMNEVWTYMDDQT